MPSFSISQFTILPGPLQGSAEFLLLSTGPTLDTTDTLHIFLENGTQTVKMQFDTIPQEI